MLTFNQRSPYRTHRNEVNDTFRSSMKRKGKTTIKGLADQYTNESRLIWKIITFILEQKNIYQKVSIDTAKFLIVPTKSCLLIQVDS